MLIPQSTARTQLSWPWFVAIPRNRTTQLSADSRKSKLPFFPFISSENRLDPTDCIGSATVTADFLSSLHG